MRQEVQIGPGQKEIIEPPIAHASTRPLAETSDIPPPDNPVTVTEDEIKSASHARIVHLFQTDAGFRKRTPVVAYAKAQAALVQERAKRKQHDEYAEKTRQRIADRGPTPDCYPSPLRPNEQIVKTFRIVSGESEEVLCAPGHLKLSVMDMHGEVQAPNDKIEVGDLLEVYAPGTKRLRFVKRAVAVDTARRPVSWEDLGHGSWGRAGDCGAAGRA